MYVHSFSSSNHKQETHRLRKSWRHSRQFTPGHLADRRRRGVLQVAKDGGWWRHHNSAPRGSRVCFAEVGYRRNVRHGFGSCSTATVGTHRDATNGVRARKVGAGHAGCTGICPRSRLLWLTGLRSIGTAIPFRRRWRWHSPWVHRSHRATPIGRTTRRWLRVRGRDSRRAVSVAGAGRRLRTSCGVGLMQQ